MTDLVTIMRDGVQMQVPRSEVFPDPSSEQRKAALLAAVNAHVAALLAAGAPIPVVDTTLHVALDDGSRADLTAMATTAIGAASGALPWPESYQQGWIAIENIRIPLPTPAEGLGLAAGVGDRYAQIRQHGRDLKDAIEAAADDAGLDVIDIESGWPALAIEINLAGADNGQPVFEDDA